MYLNGELILSYTYESADLLSNLAALAPWLAAFGEEAVRGTAHTSQEVGHWRP